MNTTLQETIQGATQKPDFQSLIPATPVGSQKSGWRRKALTAVAGLAVLAVVGGAGWKFLSKPEAPSYTATAVKRADLTRTISATGHVQAVVMVQVGSQVSGTISELHADFNDRVTKGQVIARLDPSQLQAQLTQSQASLASATAVVQTAQSGVQGADASVMASQSNVDRAQSVVADAQRTFDMNTNLVKEGVLAKNNLDSSRAAMVQAQAQLQQAIAQLSQVKMQALSARSQLEQTKAQQQQSRAAVEVAQVNLDRSVIKAPIDGVVVARNIDVGQTVAASLQAPTLFLIANDLTRMQVLADIDEADIGQLKDGADVAFTVDAFPKDTFHGKVSQIRLSPQAVQNVVTYTAVIDVANPGMKLLPGMTANLNAIVAQKKDALSVPNAAFRFRPADVAAAGTQKAAAGTQKAGAAKGSRGGQRTGSGQRGATVWVVAGTELKPVRVQTGMTDGISTEITGGALKEGDQVAVPAQQTGAKAASAAASSPFSGAGGARGGMRGGPR
ncbi:MAG: efflux RND transporter periplasmic adaptor subunit [Acidobacteriota bacterium]